MTKRERMTAAQRRYEQTEKGKATRRRYEQTAKGKATHVRYAQTEKGKRTNVRNLAKRISVGRRYLGYVADPALAQQINAHIKRRRREFISSQRAEASAPSLDA